MTLRNEVIIGNAHLLNLDFLVPGRPARLLALGSLAGYPAHAFDNPSVEPLSAINYLVVGAGGDIQQMKEAVRRMRENSPILKVILADSLEAPLFPTGVNDDTPEGVDRVISVSKKMVDVSRGLLYHKAGILTGVGGGLACGVALALAGQIEVDATVAFSFTNFDLSLQEQLHQ